MVIASIDIQNGKVVQLKQGKELILSKDNPEELAREFDRYGEVAVIDLDAAMGKGNNLDMIKPLLRIAECRVGGGIRTVEQARELVSLGARKIIVGSAAFRDPAKKGVGIEGGEFRVNTAFLEELAQKIGRERIILAVDSGENAIFRAKNRGGSPTENPAGISDESYEIYVDGWKTPTGLGLIETVRRTEKWVSEFLFTCIDREGTMTGIDLEPVKLMREAVSADHWSGQITAAGGVSTLEEIETLAALGCNVQLGMALYTGKISLAQAFIRSLNWKKAASHSPLAAPLSLLPIIAQSADGQVLMCGYADTEALEETFKRGNVCFHSRTRDKLWMKGESSGNYLRLVRLRADCDRDTILATVKPQGPVCHTGAWSCFAVDRRYTWEYLQAIIEERFQNPVPGSYTATLDNDLVREKLMEEAKELCEAETHDELVWEAADLLYFATALITRAGLKVPEILDELDRRHKK